MKIKTMYGYVDVPKFKYSRGKKYTYKALFKSKSSAMRVGESMKMVGYKLNYFTYNIPVMTGKFKGINLTALYTKTMR